MKPRLRAIAYWATAPLLMLALYWPGLVSWFQKDDFAWLGLRGLVHGPRDLAWALFAPLAQGTIRTLSERVVYLSFTSVFGLHALPFRCLAFATCAASIFMLTVVATKLSGSRAVGFWAAIVWTINGAIAIPLAWTAVYYELAWPFWLLTMFWLLLRYDESGERRFFVGQLVMFVLGFFVLEMNVVYPAICAAYAVIAGKNELLKKIAPLFAISLLYTVVHFYFAPLPVSGPYKMHWDLRVVQTLTTYWGWALGPGQGRLIGIVSTGIRSTLVWTLTAGLFAFLIIYKRKAVFALAWFLIALGPLLPLRDHIQPEYLTAPALGLAIWAGWAIVAGWRGNPIGRIAAAILFLIYAGFSMPIGQAHVRSFYERSQRIRSFVLSVTDAARAHPGKTILLTGVNTEQFNDAIYDRAFPVFGVTDLFVVPENRSKVKPASHFTEPDSFFMNPVAATKAMRGKRTVVLDVSTGIARDCTVEYTAQLKADELSPRVELGNDLFADQLGDGWYTNDGGFRWMGKRATVTLAGPRNAGERVYVAGHAPAVALRNGPIAMQLSIDGVALPAVRVRNPGSFTFDFDVPARFVAAPKIELAIELDRTFTLPPDPRVFGLVFVSIEIR